MDSLKRSSSRPRLIVSQGAPLPDFTTVLLLPIVLSNWTDIEQEIGFSILTNLFDDISYPDPDFVPSCEALEDHGDFYEMLFILGDGDEAVEIFIPKHGVDNELLAMCSQFAVVLD